MLWIVLPFFIPVPPSFFCFLIITPAFRFSRLLIYLSLSAGLIGYAGCLHRLKTRPLTPSIVQSREICREANAAMEQGRWNEAEKKMERAVKLNPKETDIRRHYAEVLWQQGKHRESLYQLEEGTKISKKEGNENGTLSLSIAEKLLSLGQIDKASRFAQRAIDLVPSEYKGWVLLGKIELNLGENQLLQGKEEQSQKHYQKAASHYYRALALLMPETEETMEILSELALLQSKMKQPQRALAILQNIERHYRPNPQPIGVIRSKAETLLEMGRTDEAMNTYRAAIEMTPDNLDLYVQLTDLQLHYGRLNDARDTMGQILYRDPNHPELARLAEQMKIVQSNRRAGG